jgi:hypothetical protein
MESDWRVIGASVQGTSHLKGDVPCQDAHGYQVLDGGLVLAAVADGAGSAERSHQGAQLAVQEVLAALSTALDKDAPTDEPAWGKLLLQTFGQARGALVQLSELEEASLRAFATTLSCTILAEGYLVVGQIGDGVTVARATDGLLFAASEPQRGEYANETFFLTQEDALERVQVYVHAEAVDALALMTDGLIRLAMNLSEGIPHAPFFGPLFDYAARVEELPRGEEQLAAFLASERVCERTDDDKTLVLVARTAKPKPQEAPETEQETETGEDQAVDKGAVDG